MDRKAETRRVWLETMAKYRRDFERPGSAKYWSPSLPSRLTGCGAKRCS